MFGLLKDKIPLFDGVRVLDTHSLRVSIGSLYGVRPNQIAPKGRVPQKKANYPHFVDKGGGSPQMCIKNFLDVNIIIFKKSQKVQFK